MSFLAAAFPRSSLTSLDFCIFSENADVCLKPSCEHMSNRIEPLNTAFCISRSLLTFCRTEFQSAFWKHRNHSKKNETPTVFRIKSNLQQKITLSRHRLFTLPLHTRTQLTHLLDHVMLPDTPSAYLSFFWFYHFFSS